jgi:hypothetical protein
MDNDSNNEIQSDKKRGRKKKIVESIAEPVEKKKRGRKKKWESFDGIKMTMPDSDDESIQSSNDTKIDEVSYDKQNVLFGNLNITVHTNKEINSTSKIKNILQNNITCDKRSTMCKIEINNSDIEDESECDTDTDTLVNYKINNPGKTTKVLNYHNDIYSQPIEMERTDIYCYNCCHPFYNKKCVLPISYDVCLKRYKVYGNFCSPNCAKRYALNDKVLCNNVHILSQMYREIYSYDYRIKPAPSRYLLKCFGGKLSIEEYRSTFTDNKIYETKPINTKTVFLEIVEK